jgi:predicted nucleic acid-binding protein
MAPPFLDTSVLLRYLVDDPPELAERATALIEGEETVLLSELAIAEAAYVLTSFYDAQRAEVVDALAGFLERENVRLCRLPKALALQALELCRPSRRVSFTDALLWAEARTMGIERILTFDRKFPSEGLDPVDRP